MHVRRVAFQLLITILLFTPLLSADSLSYEFDINTSSIAGTTGFLDVQLNPISGADAVQVSLSAFSTDGTLYSSPYAGDSGGASGSLPGVLVLQNTTAFNDVFSGIDFGNFIQFDITFSGDAISNPSTTSAGSTYSVGLYDSTASNPLLTSDPSGAVALANIGPDGSLTITGLPDENGNSSDATITPLSATSTPEPATFALLLTGCGALVLFGVRRKQIQGAITLVAALGLFVASAHAAPQIYFSTTPSATSKVKSLATAADSSSCPNQGGILQVASVPVANTVTLYIQVGSPAPFTTTFEIVSSNTAIVGGSQNQGFIPQVTLQAGATASSPFNIYGQSVGESTLQVTDLSDYYQGFSLPVTSWDLNAGDSVNKLIDTNPASNSCVTSTGVITQDPSQLAVCGASAKGVATDGITTLLMRLSAALPGTGCYSISSTSSLDQGQVQNPVTTTQSVGGLEEAFSFYSAPVNYGDSSASRTVQFTFSYTPSLSLGNGNTSSFTANLTVVRPPVLLVHGLWSKPDVWPTFFKRNDQNHWTYAANYRSTNASSFSVNFPNVKNWAASALNEARGAGIAVTQADVIAHSMGGILTRLYANSSQNTRADNFYQGDIHRIITLDTPHWGSILANLLVSLHAVAPSKVNAMKLVGRDPTQGAVCDLAENSPALLQLASTAVPGSAINASGGPFPGYQPSFRTWMLTHFLPSDRVNGFAFQSENDSVVGLIDQQGGLGGPNFPALLHSQVPQNADVATTSFGQLDGPSSSLPGMSFPAAMSTGLGNPAAAPRGVPGLGAAQDQADYASQCTPGDSMKPGPSPMSGNAKLLASSSQIKSQAAATPSLVVITSPSPGQVFHPGDSITINIQVDPSFPVTSVLVDSNANDTPDASSFFGPESSIVATQINPTTFQATLTLPATFAGPLTMGAVAFDSQGNDLESAMLTLAVQPASKPSSVFLINRYIPMNPLTSGTEELQFDGIFPGNIQLDLTSSASGTTYVSSNPSVITVDTEGNSSIATTSDGTPATGIASVTATNSGLSDYAVFVVQDPQKPLPPLDVTNSAAIQISGLTLNRQTGFFVGKLTISASGNTAIPGPLVVLLNGLTSGVSLVNGNGITVNTNAGTPYISLTLPGQGLVFAPGESLTVPVQFLDPSRALISFTPSLIRTASLP